MDSTLRRLGRELLAGRRAGAVEHPQHQLVPAVHHVVQQHAIALRRIEWPQQGERRDVLHPAARVSWRQLDVGDDGIQRIVRIEFAKRAARQRLVLSGRTECRAVEGGRDLLVDDNPGDLGAGRRGPGTRRRCAESP